uniref:Nanos-type domain-containing protein n=1 Tax=Panagrellus redivivus TaxID=6233 RepID=A0A7E4VLQ6_PANRE
MEPGYVPENVIPNGPPPGEIAGAPFYHYQVRGPPPPQGIQGHPQQYGGPVMQPPPIRPLQQSNSIGSSLAGSNPSSHAPTPAPGQQSLSHSPNGAPQGVYYPQQGPPPQVQGVRYPFPQQPRPPQQGYYQGPPQHIPQYQGVPVQQPQYNQPQQQMQGPPPYMQRPQQGPHPGQQHRMPSNGGPRPRGGFNNGNGRGGYNSGPPGSQNPGNPRYMNPMNGQRGGRGGGRGGRGGQIRKPGRNDFKPEYPKPPSNPSPESISHQSLPDFSEPPPPLPMVTNPQPMQHPPPQIPHQHAQANQMFQIAQQQHQQFAFAQQGQHFVPQYSQGYPQQQVQGQLVFAGPPPGPGGLVGAYVFTNPDGSQQIVHQMLPPNQGYPVQHVQQQYQVPYQPQYVHQPQYDGPPPQGIPQGQYIPSPPSESFTLAAMAQALQEVSEEERQKNEAAGIPAGVPAVGAHEPANEVDDYTPPGTPQELKPLNNEQLDLLASTLDAVASGEIPRVAYQPQPEPEESVTPPAEPASARKRQPKPDQERYQPPARAGRGNFQPKGFGRQPVPVTTAPAPVHQESGVWRSKSNLDKINEEEKTPIASNNDPRPDSPADATPRASPTPSTTHHAAPKPAVPMIGGIPLIIAASQGKEVDVEAVSKIATKEYCAYCAMLQKPMSTVTNHSLMSKTRGLPACPLFRENGCKLCGAKGDSAHLPEFCKHSRNPNKENVEFKELANHLFSMSFDDRRSCVIKDFNNHPTVANIASASQANEHFAHVSSQSLKRIFAKQLQFNADDLRFAMANPHYYDQQQQQQHRGGYDGGFNRPNRGGGSRGGGSNYGGRGGGSRGGGGGSSHGGYSARSSVRSNASSRYGDNSGGGNRRGGGGGGRGGPRY